MPNRFPGILPVSPNTVVGIAGQQWYSPEKVAHLGFFQVPTMHDIYLLLRTISELRSEYMPPEIDVRLKKLEREIETELMESHEARDWANC